MVVVVDLVVNMDGDGDLNMVAQRGRVPFRPCAREDPYRRGTAATDGLDGAWKVTLSYLERGDPVPEPVIGLAAFLPRPDPMPERVMKVIAIDATTFEPRSMTLRQAG